MFQGTSLGEGNVYFNLPGLPSTSNFRDPLLFILEQLLEDSNYDRAAPLLRQTLRCEQEADEATIRNLRSQFQALDILEPLFNSDGLRKQSAVA